MRDALRVPAPRACTTQIHAGCTGGKTLSVPSKHRQCCRVHGTSLPWNCRHKITCSAHITPSPRAFLYDHPAHCSEIARLRKRQTFVRFSRLANIRNRNVYKPDLKKYAAKIRCKSARNPYYTLANLAIANVKSKLTD